MSNPPLSLKDVTQIPELILQRHKEHGLPCLSDTLTKLASLDPDDDLSNQELAQIILEDYGLISRVLQTVNSFYYNRLGQEFSTVTQAVIMLGFNTVREVALGMAVMELLSNEDNEVAAKLMAKAFVGAHLAQAVSGSQTNRSPEEVFLAALFHPLARIIVAVYDPALYIAVVAMERSGDRAERRGVQNLWRQLGTRLTSEWNLPPRICEHVEAYIPPRGYVDPQLNVLITNIQVLASLMVGETSEMDPVWAIKRFGEQNRLPPSEVLDKMELAGTRTGSFSPVYKRILAQMNLRALYNEREQAQAAKKKEESGDWEWWRREAQDAEELFLDLLNQLSGAVVQRRLSLDQVYLLASEALHRGVGLDRVLLCLLTRDRQALVVRYGIGSGIRNIKERLEIPFPVKVPPLASAFQNDREMVGTWSQVPVVEEVGDEAFGAKLVCVSPLIIQGRPIGCFLLDRSTSRDSFLPKDLKRVSAIRQMVVLATTQRTPAP